VALARLLLLALPRFAELPAWLELEAAAKELESVVDWDSGHQCED
jgi:hypothetical protein